jgi:hypothetical protein
VPYPIEAFSERRPKSIEDRYGNKRLECIDFSSRGQGLVDIILDEEEGENLESCKFQRKISKESKE